MKQITLLAVMSLVALAACTKNEPAPSVTDQQEITFASPIVGVNTKAISYGPLTGNYPTTQSFNVWAWYSEKENYDGTDGIPYMTDVTVAYDSGDHNPSETENGAWVPTPTYYWPKDGKLTFDAYSPTGLTGVTCDKTTGLTITDYVVPTDLTKQIDVLYSTRAHDKVSATSFTDKNTYEGVDLMFNHALSVVAFTIKQSDDYPAGIIKVKEITIGNALSKGTFVQSVSYAGATPSANPVWNTRSTPADYKSLAHNDYADSVQPTNSEGSFGTSTIVLPQDFNDENDVTITVKYYIKNNDEEPLLQTSVFHLKETGNQSGKDASSNNDMTVSKWEMGKKYTYNLTIGLNDIFFAPTITDWVGVNVNLPTAK